MESLVNTTIYRIIGVIIIGVLLFLMGGQYETIAVFTISLFVIVIIRHYYGNSIFFRPEKYITVLRMDLKELITRVIKRIKYK